LIRAGRFNLRLDIVTYEPKLGSATISRWSSIATKNQCPRTEVPQSLDTSLEPKIEFLPFLR